MLVADLFEIPVAISLGVIAGVLALAMVASVLRARRLAALEMALELESEVPEC